MLDGQRQSPEVFAEPLEERDERMEQVATFISETLDGHFGEEVSAPEEQVAASGQPEQQSRAAILHERIIDTRHIPPVEPDPELPAISVEIVGDQEIRIGGAPVQLAGGMLYIWNTLLLSRNMSRSLQSLRAYGQELTSAAQQPKLGDRLLQLIGKFAKVSTEPVVLTDGAATHRRYRLSPQVVISDSRPPREEAEGGYAPFEDGSDGFGEPQQNKHEVFEARDRDILALVKAYEWHPDVQRTVQQYWRPRATAYEEDPDLPAGMTQNDVLSYRLLSSDETLELFERLETGLQAYRAHGGLEGLTPDEEALLMRAAAAYQVLYACNLRFVSKVALRFPEIPALSRQDHFQNGTLGLGAAIRRFDASKGTQFLTYAGWYIQQSISREFVNTGNPIHLPQSVHTELGKLRRIEEQLEQELQQEPSKEQLAEALGRSVEYVVELQAHGDMQPCSLDVPLDDGEHSLVDVLPAPVSEPTSSESRAARVAAAVTGSELTAREQAVLYFRYGRYLFPGLTDATVLTRDGEVPFAALAKQAPEDNDLTLQEVSDLFGVSRERIRQLEQDALEKLQGLPEAQRSIQRRRAAGRASRARRSA